VAKSEKKQFIPLVENDIPIPTERKARTKESQPRINWPFTSMSHGQSFLLPVGCNKSKAHAALSALKRRGELDDTASIITKLEGEAYRVWFILPIDNDSL
jgi:hypothetical protein